MLRAEQGAHHYRLQFIRFDGTAQVGYETLIAFGTDDPQSNPPHDIARWGLQPAFTPLTHTRVRGSIVTLMVTDDGGLSDGDTTTATVQGGSDPEPQAFMPGPAAAD